MEAALDHHRVPGVACVRLVFASPFVAVGFTDEHKDRRTGTLRFRRSLGQEMRGDAARAARRSDRHAGVIGWELARRFPKLAESEQGDRLPTLKQLEGFA